MCLDILGGKEGAKRGGRLTVNTCSLSQDTQDWFVENNRIKWAHKDDLCVGVIPPVWNDADLQLEDCSWAKGQEWVIKKNHLKLGPPYDKFCLTAKRTTDREVNYEM